MHYDQVTSAVLLATCDLCGCIWVWCDLLVTACKETAEKLQCTERQRYCSSPSGPESCHSCSDQRASGESCRSAESNLVDVLECCSVQWLLKEGRRPSVCRRHQASGISPSSTYPRMDKKDARAYMRGAWTPGGWVQAEPRAGAAPLWAALLGWSSLTPLSRGLRTRSHLPFFQESHQKLSG